MGGPEGDGRMPLDGRTMRWLAGEVLPGRVVARARPLAGGTTNKVVLLVTRPRGERYVLRRYRSAATRLPRNSCATETRLLRRLATDVPVPEVVGADVRGAWTGSPQMVCRMVRAMPLTRALAVVPDGEAARLGAEVGAVLARITAVDLGSSGAWKELPRQRAPERCLPDFVEECLRLGGSRVPMEERRFLRWLARRAAPLLEAEAETRRLVHGDFNPKNLLVTRHARGWRVRAVLDWEMAFVGSPLVDVGNMLRFCADYPEGFARGFTAGFGEGCCGLPAGWRAISRAFDLFALTDVLTGTADEAYFTRALAALNGYRRSCGPVPEVTGRSG